MVSRLCGLWPICGLLAPLMATKSVYGRNAHRTSKIGSLAQNISNYILLHVILNIIFHVGGRFPKLGRRWPIVFLHLSGPLNKRKTPIIIWKFLVCSGKRKWTHLGSNAEWAASGTNPVLGSIPILIEIMARVGSRRACPAIAASTPVLEQAAFEKK